MITLYITWNGRILGKFKSLAEADTYHDIWQYYHGASNVGEYIPCTFFKHNR